MFDMETSSTNYDVFDMCYGKVTGCSRKGGYIQLDNSQDAFAFGCANLRTGTEVLCTVLRKAKPDEGLLTRVSVDSVQYASPLGRLSAGEQLDLRTTHFLPPWF